MENFPPSDNVQWYLGDYTHKLLPRFVENLDRLAGN